MRDAGSGQVLLVRQVKPTNHQLDQGWWTWNDEKRWHWYVLQSFVFWILFHHWITSLGSKGGSESRKLHPINYTQPYTRPFQRPFNITFWWLTFLKVPKKWCVLRKYGWNLEQATEEEAEIKSRLFIEALTLRVSDPKQTCDGLRELAKYSRIDPNPVWSVLCLGVLGFAWLMRSSSWDPDRGRHSVCTASWQPWGMENREWMRQRSPPSSRLAFEVQRGFAQHVLEKELCRHLGFGHQNEDKTLQSFCRFKHRRI